MAEAILVAVISAGAALLGNIITNMASTRRTENSIRTNQAVTDAKLEELTREVREHNNFARRMPVVEEQIRGMDRRLEQLEQGQRRQPIS